MDYKTPTFLYIGPDKAGSTWLFRVLTWHPEVYVTPAKDLYFFDKYYERGLEWYLTYFEGAQDEQVIAEISHDYLYSSVAAKRIYETLPDVRLMVCLREPVDRAFSAYLYLLKHGLFSGSFEEALDEVPELMERGYYAKYLAPYIDLFGKGRLYVGVFDKLRADPNLFAKKLFGFLGVSVLDLPEHLRGKTLPASRARSVLLAKLVKRAALAARELGMAGLVGRVKTLPLIQRILYRPYSEGEKPAPAPDTVRRLREHYAPAIAELDVLLGTNFQELWGYK